MAELLPSPKWRLPKNNGTPAANWVVFTYSTGGPVTRKATYTTAEATTSNGYSFTLDARGEADVWWDGLYYIEVYKSAAEGGGLVFTLDNYGSQSTATTTAPNAIINGSFENGVTGSGSPQDWGITTYTGSSFLVDTTSVAHGAHSAKGVSTGSGGAVLLTNAFTACSELESIFWRFFTKASVANMRNVVEILWYDSAQVYISSTSLYDDSATNPTSWTMFSGVSVPVATALYYRVQVTLGHPSVATVGSSWADGFEFGTAPRVETGNTWQKAQVFSAPITANGAIASNGALTVGAAGSLSLTNGSTGNVWTTGDVKLTLKTTADSGWVIMDDGTIGNAASAASTRANADTEALFTLLWTNTLDAWCPVVTGRGASAAADFAANKEITLPRMLGRALAVSGAGSTLTARVLAQYLGEENHTLTTAELASHAHQEQVSTDGLNAVAANLVTGAGGNAFSYPAATNTPAGASAVAINTATAGSGTAHNNMQPSSFLNVMVKL